MKNNNCDMKMGKENGQKLYMRNAIGIENRILLYMTQIKIEK